MMDKYKRNLRVKGIKVYHYNPHVATLPKNSWKGWVFSLLMFDLIFLLIFAGLAGVNGDYGKGSFYLLAVIFILMLIIWREEYE